MFSGFGGGKKSEETPGTKAMELSKPPEIKSGGSIHGFDPTALERAAKAAKDLDSSKNSKESSAM